MHVVVATHGHCFDGLASAVLFTHLVGAVAPRRARFSYYGCGYGAGQRKPAAAWLSGDENAILDYRYFDGPKLSWYFDHHPTAFASDDDRRSFESKVADRRFFYDPGYGSCARLIADVARARFSVELPEPLSHLVEWADKIDTASFDDAEQATSRSHPIARLVSVVEHCGDDRFLNRYVPQLLALGLPAVAALPEIEERYRPLGEKQARYVERVRQRAERRGRVVYVDLTDANVESVGKFVTYALYPECTYSVVVALIGNGIKISVGYNPWCGSPLDTDISAICARFGGGGHPVVGGIAFKTAELERARAIATQIADELNG